MHTPLSLSITTITSLFLSLSLFLPFLPTLSSFVINLPPNNDFCITLDEGAYSHFRKLKQPPSPKGVFKGTKKGRAMSKAAQALSERVQDVLPSYQKFTHIGGNFDIIPTDEYGDDFVYSLVGISAVVLKVDVGHTPLRSSSFSSSKTKRVEGEDGSKSGDSADGEPAPEAETEAELGLQDAPSENSKKYPHAELLWQSIPGSPESSFFLTVSPTTATTTLHQYIFCIQNFVDEPLGVWPDENGLSPSGDAESGLGGGGWDVQVGFNFRGISNVDDEESRDSEAEIAALKNAKDKNKNSKDKDKADTDANIDNEKETELEHASLTTLKTTLTELSESLQTLSDHQSYMRQRESAHRDLSETIHNKVCKWTLFEGVLLGVVGIGQGWRMKRFFEMKRRF